MNKITKGNIVKFVDPDGLINGGTVVEFTKKDNEEYLMINTLDGKRVLKKKSIVSPIKRQQRGRVSAKFMEDFKEEIRIENENLPIKEVQIIKKKMKESTDGVQIGTEEQDKMIDDLKKQLSDRDSVIKTLKCEIESLSEHIGLLNSRIANSSSPKNVDNLSITVKGLSDALLAASINKEGDMVQELLKIISKLNNID